MISTQPGFIPQEKSQLARGRIWAFTVFVDYYIDFAFAALMRDVTAESTLAAEREFEYRCSVCRIKVKQYHADNVVLLNLNL